MAPRIRYPVPNLTVQGGARYELPRFSAPVTDDQGNVLPDHAYFESDVIRFEDDHRDDMAWYFQRVLGRGGFGLVGLWSKFDENNTVVDDLAVKELLMPRHDLFPLVDGGRPLPQEAIIQVGLQKKDCIPVLQMRGLSVFTAPLGRREKIRYYLEYCPSGTLREIMNAYHHLLSSDPNTVASVPEPYLWQLLYDFTQVMLAMEQQPFYHPNERVPQTPQDKPFILHLDVKLDNVMLGLPADDEIVLGYPSTKVGDWGVATLTSLTDRANSRRWNGAGTRRWRPPEHINNGTWGAGWDHQPPWRISAVNNHHAFTTAHTVFAFASVIFKLMIVDSDNQTLDAAIRTAETLEATVRARRFRYVEPDWMDVNLFGRPTRYTPLLKNTIANCLNFDPAQRPTAEYLNHLAHDMCRQHAAQQYQNGPNSTQTLHVPDPSAP